MNTFLVETIQCKNIQSYLDRNLSNYFSKCGNEFDLNHYLNELETDRTHEIDTISEELKATRRLLILRKNINFENANNADLKSFKKDMIKIQDKIQTLKIKLFTAKDILKSEEEKLIEENSFLENKIYEWEVSMKRGVSSKSAPCMYNGWPQEDHKIFIKLRGRYKNIDDLASKINQLLPHISVECIKEHEEWYKNYLSLRKEKNDAVQMWKKSKKENHTVTDVIQNDNNRKRPKPNLADREIIRKQIAEWKKEKELKCRQDFSQRQIQVIQEKHNDEEKQKIKEKAKDEVARWRQTKIEEESREKGEQLLNEYFQQKIKAAVANKLIKNYQYRDKLMETKRKPSRSDEEKIKRKHVKVPNIVNNDPERFLKPTKQWLRRTLKNEENNKISSYVPNIREIQKLKVPQWRKQ